MKKKHITIFMTLEDSAMLDRLCASYNVKEAKIISEKHDVHVRRMGGVPTRLAVIHEAIDALCALPPLKREAKLVCYETSLDIREPTRKKIEALTQKYGKTLSNVVRAAIRHFASVRLRGKE